LAEAAQRAEALGDSLLRHRGGAAALGDALDAAGVELRAGEVLVMLGAGAVVALAAGWALVGPLVGLVLGTLVVVAGRITLDVLARRRRRQFADQLPETLQILAGSLRAGHGLAQGLDTVSREAESPTADEFRRLTIETRLGRDLVDAMSAVTERVRSEDFRWVVQAIDIQREVGGDLAEVLDNVGGTIRDRTRIRRQVSTLSAEGRLSAVVLMVLPFGLAAVMSVTNRSYLGPLYQSGTGHVLLAVAAVLLAAGGVWLRRIVKPIF
jgi:tight adherence protein B